MGYLCAIASLAFSVSAVLVLSYEQNRRITDRITEANNHYTHATTDSNIHDLCGCKRLKTLIL